MSILPQTTKQDYVGPFALNQVHIGHCLDLLKQLPDKCIHSVITSPPYWGLRDYLTQPIHWDSVSYSPIAGLPPITIPEQMAPLGLEPDIWAFVGHLVAIFREVKRVLRDDGTLWLNLGDSYITSPPGNNGKHNPDTLGDGAYKRRQERQLGHGESMEAIYQKPKDLKMKDLAAIPWRVALALQADGWYLRSEIIWHKTNPMPESIKDRPTKAHEQVFLLSKNERYFYDAEAIREACLPESYERDKYPDGERKVTARDYGVKELTGNMKPGMRVASNPAGRNKRTVWAISTQSYSAAHFATFPEKLVTPMVLASTSECGVCGVCGNPWQRNIKRSFDGEYNKTEGQAQRIRANTMSGGTEKVTLGRTDDISRVTTGWQPTCQCDAPITPTIILDPFAGSGTTLQVAIKHRRRGLGFDNNETYATDLVGDRLNGTQIQFA